jgi:hypothetical protein
MHRRGGRARLTHLLDRPTVMSFAGDRGQAVHGTGPLNHQLRTLVEEFAGSPYRCRDRYRTASFVAAKREPEVPEAHGIIRDETFTRGDRRYRGYPMILAAGFARWTGRSKVHHHRPHASHTGPALPKIQCHQDCPAASSRMRLSVAPF